ncbi:MAG: RcnB family protein [Phyllobacterium sp.]
MKKAILAAVALSLLATPAALAQSYKNPQGQPHHGYSQSEKYKGKHKQERYRHGKPEVNRKKISQHKWQRGHKLPNNYRKHVVRDYHRSHLSKPPRGHQWIKVDNDYLLVGITSGIIASLIQGR